MKKFYVFLPLYFAFCLQLFGEKIAVLPSPIDYGPWPIDKFCAVASKYYQALAKKNWDPGVVALNNLEDVESRPNSGGLINAGKPRIGAGDLTVRWGRKTQLVTPVYHVVEYDNAVFKNEFRDIFGKEVKHYQAVCVVYPVADEEGKRNLALLDPSGVFALGVVSNIDLWVMDEDGKCYVIMAYEPSRGFKGNLTQKVLNRVGVHGAKLWKE